MVKMAVTLFILVFSQNLLCSNLFAGNGDKKIQDTIERIQSEDKGQGKSGDNGKKTDENNDKKADNNDNCVAYVPDPYIENAADYQYDGPAYSAPVPNNAALPAGDIRLRFADYPYSSPECYFNSFAAGSGPETNRFFYFNASAGAAYYFDGIFSLMANAEANLSVFHLDYQGQAIFSFNSAFREDVFSAGITIPFPDVLINLYAGVAKLDFLDDPSLSCGASARLFLPGNISVDMRGLLTQYRSGVTAALNYSIDRFNVGLGYSYNDFSGIVYAGPVVSLTCWL